MNCQQDIFRVQIVYFRMSTNENKNPPYQTLNKSLASGIWPQMNPFYFGHHKPQGMCKSHWLILTVNIIQDLILRYTLIPLSLFYIPWATDSPYRLWCRVTSNARREKKIFEHGPFPQNSCITIHFVKKRFDPNCEINKTNPHENFPLDSIY